MKTGTACIRHHNVVQFSGYSDRGCTHICMHLFIESHQSQVGVHLVEFKRTIVMAITLAMRYVATSDDVYSIR